MIGYIIKVINFILNFILNFITGHKFMIFGITAVIVCLIVLVCVYFFIIKNKPDKEKKPAVSRKYKNNAAELINLLAKEDKTNDIILGKRENRYFLCFKNKYFEPFFAEWFGLMKLLNDGIISEETYYSVFNETCKKFGVKTEATAEKAEDMKKEAVSSEAAAEPDNTPEPNKASQKEV